MKRKSYGRDKGLSLRSVATGGVLGLLFVLFAVVPFNVLNLALVPAIIIVVGLAAVQYWASDRLSLAASGAENVSQGEEAGLAARVEARQGRPAEAAHPPRRHSRPERVRDGPQSQARCGRRHDRSLEAARGARAR